MPTLNRCEFIGRLGKNPEMSNIPNGKSVTKFSLAVDQGKDQPTMWLNITCWDKLAETVEKYACKGMLVFVQGKLQLRKYKDRNKADQLSVEIIANDVQLLEKRQKEGDELPDSVLPEA
jgi:single-strand DNA-binding protein